MSIATDLQYLSMFIGSLVLVLVCVCVCVTGEGQNAQERGAKE